jgi:predicted CXXCH cytochrome family protein
MKSIPYIKQWSSALRLFRVVAFAVLFGFLFRGFDTLAQNANSIVNSKHNLSVSSPGSVHASTESEICIFCHTPHFATGDGPLWNHQMSAAVYQPYSSSTMKATVGQPTGASRLCLSCHDGTVALGMVHSRNGGIAMNTLTMPPTSPSYLGKDLSGDHPVSFVYDNALATADGNLRSPDTLPPDVHLDRTGQLQCTACHDPHNDQYGNFLVMDNTGSALCLACHNIVNWPTSAHATSGKPLPSVMVNMLAANQSATAKAKATKVQTVAEASCASCHVPHAAGSKEELTRFLDPEKNCQLCHNSQGPGRNVMSEFNKISSHPIFIDSQSHTPQENMVNPPQRHVTCVDCHNPHAANNAVGTRTTIPGALAGVTGMSAGGTVMHNVQHEYELCFRCHADSAQRGPARVPRQYVETNTRREFSPSNTSFHPVEAAGKNFMVPSLIQPLNTTTMVGCTDCHNSDQGPGNGGGGAKGPHGSAFVPLLERMLLLNDGTPYNPDNFALCYKCHSPTVVDSQLPTSWTFHQKHIETCRATCTTCHDSHAANVPHLINFNTIYVTPFNGELRYTSTGQNHGICTLTCHDGNGQNHAHNNVKY